MTDLRKTVHEASKLLARRAKLAKLIHHYTGQLVELDAELCSCMTGAVQTFGPEVGLDDPDPVIELKEDENEGGN